MGQWCYLPDDILTRILSHLFGKDYTSFLAVCRSWRSAPPPLRSIPDPFSTAPEYPSLLHISGNSSDCNFYNPFYNGSYVAQIPDELIGARIFFSNHGWLLMSQEYQLFFFHPLSKQRIDLPLQCLAQIQGCGRMCFTSPPTSPDCMVFAIDGDFKKGCYISSLSRGQRRWRQSRIDETNVRFYSSHSNPVFYQGAFYALTMDGKLGVFDPKKIGSHCWKIIYELNYPCESIQDNFLVESNGELVSICIGRNGEYVRIFELELELELERRWVEVTSLGDNMIFVSRTGCISMQTHTMGNTIYFPSFNIGGNGLFYSLASHKFHSLGLTLARKDLCDTKRMLRCSWIIPTASEIYTKDELRWFLNPDEFIPSGGRVKVKGAPSARPLFILTNREDPTNQLFYSIFDSCHNARVIPEVQQMRTVTCAFGWLFLVDREYSDCLLLNPQTMEKIHLPRLPEKFNICAISSSPNDPNCVVLLIHYEEYVRINFSYCRPGESEWMMVKVCKKKPVEVNPNFNESKNSTRSDSDDEDTEVKLKCLLLDPITNVIGYRGKIYGLRIRSDWVKIEFDPIFKVKQRDGFWLPRACYFGVESDKTYMVESCGELFVVQINFRDDSEVYDGTVIQSKITEVAVFKLDFTIMEWEKVGSLGENIAFFCYGQSCCISSSSMETGKGNSIYFIGCFSDVESIYAFHFDDGSISISSPFPELDMKDFEWTALTLS